MIPFAGAERIITACLGLLFLVACAADPYTPPEVHPGAVWWVFVEPGQVAAACHDAQEPRVDGCYLGDNTIVTAKPTSGDYDLPEILQHEVAHSQGWTHPAWPGGTK